MPLYDFSSPFLAAAIVNTDGSRYPLWTNAFAQGDVRPQNVREDVPSLPYLADLTVEIELSYLPKISATLTPPFREGIAFLDSELIEWGDSALEVQFGYVAGTNGQPVIAGPFTGVLLQPDVSIGEDITIQLQAQGTGGFSMIRQTGSRVAAEGETRRQLLRRIAGGPSGTRAIEVDFSDADQNAACKQKLDQITTYVQGSKTDWLAIYELTDQCQTWMILVGSTLRIVSRESAIRRAPTRALRLFDYRGGRIGGRESTAGGVQGEYPILSFSSEFAGAYLPGAVRGVVLSELSEDDRLPYVDVINDESDAPARTGHGAAAPFASEHGLPGLDPNTGDGGAPVPGDSANQDVVEHATAEFRRMGDMGVTCEIETVGIPDIFPAEVVSVFGVGRRFSDQNYYVTKVIHSIGQGGFTTRLSLVSNIGSQLEGASSFGPESTSLATAASTDEDAVVVDPLSEEGFDEFIRAGA